MNSLVFLDFLEDTFLNFIQKYKEKKLAMIIDSWPGHKTNHIKKLVVENSIRLIFNLTRNSRANPIEYFFGHLKNKLKNIRYDNY